MALNKPLYHTITEKLWPDYSAAEQHRLYGMLMPLGILFIATLVHFIYNLFAKEIDFCTLCDAGVVMVSFLAVICLVNGKISCSLNMAFFIPVFVYAYYLSDFSPYPQLTSTVYMSASWLLAGAFFLMYFSETSTKIHFYFILSALTIILQLYKGNQFFGLFAGTTYMVPHPLITYTSLFAGGYLIRRRFLLVAEHLNNEINTTRQGISRVVRQASFPVAEIKAIRDEQGNVLKLQIEKVNLAFESVFNIQLYEAKDQEANYIFELVMRDYFDLNRLLLFDSPKIKEYHATRLDMWFKIHVLKPGLNNFYVILEDITKIKKKLAELENSRQRYKVLLEAIPDMFFVIGKDGTYEDFVVKESDLFKVEDANIIGSSIFDVGFPRNMAEKILECIHISLKNNSIETIEYSLNTPNGTYLYEMRLARLNARSVISVARDITRRKTAEFNLEKAKIKAEESDRLKSAFLANLSHEIRTPLNIITNFTRMLADGSLGRDERMELSDAISQNGLQLLNMIDNTIHLSKIETNTVDIVTGFCSVNQLMRDIYNRFRPLVPDGRQVKIMLDIDVPNQAFGFITDRRLLLEALHILVDNAVKYTLRGEVKMGYQMLLNEEVKFFVSDTGIGIPEEEMENIFSRFYRIKNEINDVTSGSGIGLSIAQHYIQLLGGELHIESKPGKGSTFWFSLPFREGQGYLRVVS